MESSDRSLRIRTYSGTAPSMRVIQMVLMVVAACISLLLDTRASYACTCETPWPSPSEKLREQSFVFSGRVLASYEFEVLGRELTTTDDKGNEITFHEIERLTRIYEFRVHAIWKGDLDEIIWLSDYDLNSSCSGERLSVGSVYLIYGGLHACSPSVPLRYAAEDIAELGEGWSPIPGTSAPVPEIMQKRASAWKPDADQTTAGVMSPTPVVTAAKETPTPTPQVPTPTRTPEAVTPTLAPITAAPTPTPTAVTPTSTPTAVTPTSTPATETPSRTPVPLTQSATPEGAAPAPGSDPERTAPSTAASEQQLSPPWPLVLLVALLAAALIGSVALVRTRRTRQIEE